MSQGTSCKCPESKKPVRQRDWDVIQRNARCSAFDGYQVRYSDYSAVRCKACGVVWRTKANFVAILRNAPPDWAKHPTGNAHFGQVAGHCDERFM